MKKVIIGVVIAVLILGIGTGGVLFWGYSNAKTDKVYAQKASTLVNDYQKKYSQDYLQNKMKNFVTSEGQITTLSDSLNQAKTDAQNDLNTLHAAKSSNRVSKEKQETEDYFNITIKSIDTSISYLDYAKTLIAVENNMNSVSSMGGEASSLEGAASQMDSAKAAVDKAISDLDKIQVPDAFKDYNAKFKADLVQFSQLLGSMANAMHAGDLSLIQSYTDQIYSLGVAMAALQSPTDISKYLISADDQKKLDEIPGQLSSDASALSNKIFAF